MHNYYKKNNITVSDKWTSAAKMVETSKKMKICPTSLRLYHYAGNNPVKYIDPDGRSSWDDFTYLTYAYFANIMQNSISAGYRNFKGKVKNFFSNLYSKKGSVKITGNASFSTVSGELLIYECNTISKSDILTINAFDKNAFAGNIKDFIDSPVFVTSDCISMSIKVLSVEVSEDKKGIATLSIGLSAPLPPGVSAGFQIQFSASVNDGKYGTFENGKDPEINQRVNNFNKTSEKVRDGYIMCFGGSL